MNFHYDAGNRFTSIVDSVSGTITPGFDGLDRLTSSASPQGTVSYTYDNASRRATMTVPGQAVANYTFDNADRLTQIAQGSAMVQFSYDNANRRATLTLPNGIVTSYAYDSASQLTALTYQNGSTTLGNLTYGYDLAGRRLSVGGTYARTNLPLAVSTTAYNANNQLTTWGTANLFYDLNGNMTSDGTHSYTWDARNRLSTIDSGSTASFNYDTFGRRSSKTMVGAQTGFLYDGANAVQELSGTTPTANPLSGGVDEVFQRTDSAGARSFLTDALGSTLALADSSGTIQTSYTFEPFGNATQSGSSTTNSFAYTGRELDAGNLYFYRARYYNPSFQRFISEDPIGFGGGDTNLYSYVWSGPTNFIDPSGLYTGIDDAIFAGGGAAVGLVGQGFGDLLSGHLSSPQTYAGAFVGGAVGGEALLYTGPVLAGAAGGAAGNATKQLLNHITKGCDLSATRVIGATAMGATSGLLPGARVPGIDIGRNSMNALANAMRTKLANRTISSVSVDTAVQMAIGRAAATGMIPGALGVGAASSVPITAGRQCGCE